MKAPTQKARPSSSKSGASMSQSEAVNRVLALRAALRANKIKVPKEA